MYGTRRRSLEDASVRESTRVVAVLFFPQDGKSSEKVEANTMERRERKKREAILLRFKGKARETGGKSDVRKSTAARLGWRKAVECERAKGKTRTGST